MVMKCMLRIFLLALVMVPAIVGATEPIKNLKNVPISLKADGTSFTDQEISAAIIEGCIAKGWSPLVTDQGAIRATIAPRVHFAEVEITYTPTTYSITYVSSRKLDYKHYKTRPDRIHKNYNNWVVKLSASISRAFHTTSFRTALVPADAHTGAIGERGKQDMYSELMKLDELRKKGILTDEEFEAQKKRLLEAQ
jgi:hypothetical protein